MLGVDIKAHFKDSPYSRLQNSSHCLAMNSIVALEYQYWFMSAFSLCFTRKRLSPSTIDKFKFKLVKVIN
jgi:hypothetical protein